MSELNRFFQTEPNQTHSKPNPSFFFKNCTKTELKFKNPFRTSLLICCHRRAGNDKMLSWCAALVSVSEEVRSRCHLKHRFCSMHISESTSNDSIYGDLSYPPPQHLSHHGTLHHLTGANQVAVSYNHHSVIPTVSLAHPAPVSTSAGFAAGMYSVYTVCISH